MQSLMMPLPFKVQHRFPTKPEDSLFHGIKTGTKQNGVQFLHVQLIGDMVDGYSRMKGSLSSSSVATVCSSKSPSFVVGGPLSTNDADEIESDQEYNYVSVDDSKLEFDTLDGLSIATKNWTEQCFSTNKGTKACSRNVTKSSTTSSQFSTSSKEIMVKDRLHWPFKLDLIP
jgi:hypothetical protein